MPRYATRLGPPAVGLALVVLLGFAGPTRPHSDTDVWWHLQTGELILDSGAIPRSDPFSWSAQGRDWVTHEWGAQVIFAALERAGGPAVLLVLSGVLVGASVLLVQRTLRRTGAGPWTVAIVSLVTLFLSSLVWTLRPHLFSLFFVAFFLDRLIAARAGPHRATWLLVPATVLWANLHGAFVLGPLLVLLFAGISWVEGHPAARRLALVGGACLVAGCLNPNGPLLYLYPLHVASVSGLIDEWAPPDPRSPHGFVFVLMALGSLALLAWKRRAVDVAQLGAGVVFALLGLAALKNVAFAGIVLAPLAAAAVDGWIPRDSAAGGREAVALRGLIAVATVAAVGLAIANLAGRSESELLVERSFPAAAVRALEQQPPGRLANPYNWGGYIIYRAPGFPVSIDGRNDMYGRRLFERQLLLEDLRPGWDDFLEDNDVRYVLWQRKRPLAEALRLSEEWNLIHEDRLAVLFERAN